MFPFAVPDKLYIRGRWEEATGKTFEPVFNPATGEVLAEAPVAAVGDVVAAADAAREAFDKGPWPRMSMAERIAVLERFLTVLESREAEMRMVLRLEAGSTDMLTSGSQWGAVPILFRHGLALAALMEDQTTPLWHVPDMSGSGKTIVSSAIITYDPIGVIAAITPYNFPLLSNVTKLVPALVTGNTLVLKPSPFTPFCALILGEVAQAAGLPPGVLNIITGGADAGAALTTDPRVDMITFTGSDTVGAGIMAQAAPSLKRVHFELGGKSALIVMPDADLVAAAQIAVGNISMHAGQGCGLTTRWLVHNSIRPAFAEIAKQVVQHMKVGDPADPTAVVGPLIREQARARSERFVSEALDSGARLVFGGKRPEGLPDGGYFFEPTLFDDVDNASALAQKEIFGPVGAMIGFDTPEEAVDLANASDFGLHGGIFSGDTAKALEMARQIRTGQVWINGGPGGLAPTLPFGGYKRSGVGREQGPNWLREFVEEKAIAYPIG